MNDLINRQDAIDAICKDCEYYNNEKVIDAINNLPSAEVRTEMSLADCVSRQTVLQCIKESRDNIDWGQSEDGDAFLHYTGALYRTIASEECLPSAEPCDNCIHDAEEWDSEACDGCVRGTGQKVAHIQDFTQYQIDWLTAHCDLELEPELESWVIRFLKDTAECYEAEYLSSAERKGKWMEHYCDEDGYVDGIECSCCHEWWYMGGNLPNFCPNCGADMRGEEE